MTAIASDTQIPVNIQAKHDIASSADSSPSSRSSSSSDDVFSNGYARSSQSSAPSSTKGSPITYDSELASDAESFTASRDLEQSLTQASIGRSDNQPQCVAAELRRHPRRTCKRVESRTLKNDLSSKKPVPTLIRQCDRKEQFVEALVDTTTEMIEVIWPLSVAQCSLPQGGGKNILGLRKFVQEVLRRSKTSYSTLQVALFYLVLLIPYVPRPEVPERREDPPVCRALRCGRRMFLAALILASKYLQDRNYTMLAWAKISGLKKEEICFNELAFLRTVDYDLHIPEQLFKEWADIVLKYSLEDECRRARALSGGRCEKWRAIVPHLTRDLSMVATAKLESPGWTQQWTPPASPVSSSASSRSDSPVNSFGFARPPPPRFLEPKAMTTAEMGLRSPKPSKLETPCLPPIGFDCPPAASGSRLSGLGRSSSIGLAMQHVGVNSINRACVDGWPAGKPARITACPRRSCLSTASANSPQSGVCDTATWRRNPTAGEETGKDTALTPLGSREYCPSALATPSPRYDRASNTVRARRDASVARSGVSTPMSMDSMTDGSSISSENDEISTPKVTDASARPLVRLARKRERPLSVCEGETDATSTTAIPTRVTSIVKHAGGIPVDYGVGVDNTLGRSRHVRSASGGCDGARKRNCMA